MGNNWIAKGVGAVFVVIAGLGFKFWQKSQDLSATKTELVTLCAGDAPCVAAVNAHVEACFDQSYSMGGRRQSASLNTQALASCINLRSGQPLFEAH